MGHIIYIDDPTMTYVQCKKYETDGDFSRWIIVSAKDIIKIGTSVDGKVDLTDDVKQICFPMHNVKRIVTYFEEVSSVKGGTTNATKA